MTTTHPGTGKYFVNGLQVIAAIFTGTIISTHLADSKVFVSCKEALGTRQGVHVENSQIKSTDTIDMTHLGEKIKATPALSSDFEHRTKEQKTMVRFCIFFILRNSPYVPQLHARSCEKPTHTMDMLQEEHGGDCEQGAAIEKFVLDCVRLLRPVSYAVLDTVVFAAALGASYTHMSIVSRYDFQFCPAHAHTGQ